MKVHITYMAKIKKLVGVASETIEFVDSCTIQEFIIKNLCRQHKKMGSYILNSNGDIREIIAIFIGSQKVELHIPIELKDGDEIIIMSPITGG